LAAVNGPASVVVSGDEDACLEIGRHWAAAGRRVRRLTVSHAFHSPLMEPMQARFAAELSGVTFAEPALDHVTDLAGLGVTTGWSEPAYWVEQIRRPVMFQAVVERLHERGTNAFVEIGPRPVLSAMVRDSLPDDDAGALVTALHRKGRPEPLAVAGCVAELFVGGTSVDWSPFTAGGRPVDLPTYAFDRRGGWLTADASADFASAGLRKAAHPMLRMAVDVGGDGVVATGRLSVADLPWLGEHRMGGALIVPGTAMLDLVLDVAAQAGCELVEELTFETPMALPAEGDLLVQLVLGGGESRTVRVYSRTDDVAEWTRHASGTVTAAAARPAGDTDWAAAWPPAGAVAEPFDDEAYERLAERGYNYGEPFRAVRGVWRRGDEIFAEVTGDRGLDVAGYGLHPVLLDAALHPYVLTGDPGELRLPFQFQNVRLAATGATTLRVRLAPTSPDTLAVQAADSAGAPVLEVEALAVRAVPAGFRPAAAGQNPLFGIEWEDVPVTPGGEQPSVCLTDGSLTDVTGRPDVIVLAVPADADPLDATGRVLEALQRWHASETLSDSRLVVVTERAVVTAPGELPATVGVSAVWGLVRVALVEFPGRVVLADVDGGEGWLAGVVAAVGAGLSQVAVRGGRLRVPRLVRGGGGGLAVPAGGSWLLRSTGGGTFDGLALVAGDAGSRRLAGGEVRVAVRAAGVNFRDVVVALGMVAGLEGLGGEGAGVVLEVGAEVTGLVPGDRVFGLLPDAFGPVAVVDARLVARVPEGWTFAQAASVPIVFLTAYYGLVELAGLRAGQRVLVHAAAGGVGMAAVQLARHLGARVFATASPGKWHVLRGQGFAEAELASSRTVEFERRFTGGVDVVLNSLAGEFIDASLRLLSAGGRFIEMGKTDIRPAREVARQYPGVSYQAFDLPDAGPDLIARMFDQILRLFAAGRLRLLPKVCFDVRRAPDALRYLSQARHIGKVVLTVPATVSSADAAADPGAVLITGGTGALGRLVATHLVEQHGARRLVLAARRGGDAPGMAEFTAALRRHGADVRVVACDVADRDQVHQLVAGIDRLDTVIHTAGVLDDAAIVNLDRDRLRTTWAAKADAAWWLHEATTGHDLSRFILFSSIAATLGSPGQGNYAAANAYLDALATWRHQHGQPATAIAWGLWHTPTSAMTGHLTDTDTARLARTGITPMSPDHALTLLDAALTTDQPTTIAATIELSGAATELSDTATLPPMLRGLAPGARRRAQAQTRYDEPGLHDRLAALSGVDRLRAVEDLVRQQASIVLAQGSAEAVDPEQPFREAGFDSLTSVELRNRLSGITGLQLAATVIFDHPTPRRLAEHLERELAPAAEDPLAEVERLLDAGIARPGLAELLRRYLDRLSPGSSGEGSLDAASDEELFELIDGAQRKG
jgi:NADPH:quinone reductase-like Zn-dependent oxidoreductase/malonyl CoA-acyl carrier protein transacylase